MAKEKNGLIRGKGRGGGQARGRGAGRTFRTYGPLANLVDC